LGCIAFRLVQIQLDPDMRLSQEDLFHIGKAEYRIDRGSIRDRTGRVLAKDRRVPSLFADPRKVSDPAALARLLHDRLGVEYDEVYAELAKRNSDGNLR